MATLAPGGAAAVAAAKEGREAGEGTGADVRGMAAARPYDVECRGGAAGGGGP